MVIHPAMEPRLPDAVGAGGAALGRWWAAGGFWGRLGGSLLGGHLHVVVPPRHVGTPWGQVHLRSVCGLRHAAAHPAHVSEGRWSVPEGCREVS